MWSQMTIQIGSKDSPAKLDINLFCGWETASSQIRLCIVLSAMYTTFLAYRSVVSESRSLADRVSNFNLVYILI